LQREDLPFLRTSFKAEELETPTGNAAIIAAEQKANRDEATRKAMETYTASRSAVCLCAV
jgi:hypothetical protein